jgi:hypothetical protein
MIIEDQQSGDVVSTTCLIPWRVRFEGVDLRVAMLEMVVTHPDYRRRGLVRTQVQRFQQMVSQSEYDYSIIQGIPYYFVSMGTPTPSTISPGSSCRPGGSEPRSDEPPRYEAAQGIAERRRRPVRARRKRREAQFLYDAARAQLLEYLAEWHDLQWRVIEIIHPRTRRLYCSAGAAG